MNPKFYLYVNGILTNPKDTKAWTDRAVIWTESLGKPFTARAYEYFCDAILRRLGQSKRVKDVAAIVEKYDELGFDVCLVGHSNGADIICRLLQDYDLKVKEIHLVAGACERDCNRNGINQALYDDRLDKVFLYCSKMDSALKLARNTHWLLGLVGLGYGTMGLEGPVNELKADTTVIWRDLDHSECWDEKHFDETLRLITHRPK